MSTPPGDSLGDRDTLSRLNAPGVRSYMDVVARVEALVLSRCPALFRPSPMPAEEVLGLAEALAAAAREAAGGAATTPTPTVDRSRRAS